MRLEGRSLFQELMWICSGLFLARVIGQAVQRWWPQTWLPPFERWQGSSLPYWLLLSSQIVILILMFRGCRRAWHGTRRSAVVGKWLLAFGLIYMGLALARLAVGAFFQDAPVWYKAWISGVFHVVLAGYLLAYAGYHLAREFVSAHLR
jgi:hypothetical protein